MNINISTIPHSNQRYETVGDYIFDDSGNILITVSDLGNRDYNALVAIHELVEALLIRKAGISEEDITLFDKKFEFNRREGNYDEPGDDPKAPYRKQHFIATNIERQLADLLGVDWKLYEEAINNL